MPQSAELARNTRSDEHAFALSGYHLDVLLADAHVGGLNFKQLFTKCMQDSGTTVPPWKVPRRAVRALALARYFSRSLEVSGARAECGTLRGFSALMMSHLARAAAPEFRGESMHVIDSFEGLSEPTTQDAVADPTTPGRKIFPAGKGTMACSLEHVRQVLREFPLTRYHAGWIPEVLASLPDTEWAFVHIDVDLYEPTLGCLEYFVPRLARGGMIINDDYASSLFPGGGLAWDEYCERHGLAFAALDSGQAVLIQGL